MKDDFSFEEFKRTPTNVLKKILCKKCLHIFKIVRYDSDSFIKINNSKIFDIRVLVINCPYCDNVSMNTDKKNFVED